MQMPVDSQNPMMNMHHPDDFLGVPSLIYEPLLQPIQQVTSTLAASDSALETRTVYDALSRSQKQLDRLIWLAKQMRRMIVGDMEAAWQALAEIDALVSSQNTGGKPLPTPTSGNIPTDNEQQAGTSFGSMNMGTAEATDAFVHFSLTAVVDIFAGVAYLARADTVALKSMLTAVRDMVSGLVAPLAVLSQLATAYLNNKEQADALSAALRSFATGSSLPDWPIWDSQHIPPWTNSDDTDELSHFLRALDELYQRWEANNPVTYWLSLISEERNTSAIVQLSAAAVWTGDQITLTADAALPFDQQQPARVGVFFTPGAQADVVNWQANEIAITVPEKAATGSVYFGRILGADEEQSIRNKCQEFATRFLNAWIESIFPLQPLPNWARPSSASQGHQNSLTVYHRPRIASFVGVDEVGHIITNNPIPTGSQVDLSWTVLFDTPMPPQISILMGNEIIQQALRPLGSLRMQCSEDQTFTCKATDNHSPVPHTAIWNVHITTSNGGKVTGEAPGSEMAPMSMRWMSPSKVVPMGGGGGGEDIISAQFGKFDPIDPNRDLGIVAVHAVLLKTGHVLFFSFDERPGPVGGVGEKQFPDWYFTDPNRGKFRLFDPDPDGDRGHVIDPNEALLANNPFCAGQCVLPDGRVLIAGGQGAGGGADVLPLANPSLGVGVESLFLDDVSGSDKFLYTYDPDTRRWDRWQDLHDRRYYPTCATLPNGQAFIAGGFSNLSRESIFDKLFGIQWNQNDKYELFDGQTLSGQHDFKSVLVYPILQVLPAYGFTPLMFVHTRRMTYLFNYGLGEPSPVGVFIGDNNNELRFDSLHPGVNGSQTYPFQAGHVLLPIGPEKGIVKILIVGGSPTDHQGDGSQDALKEAWIFECDPDHPATSRWRPTQGTPGFGRIMGDTVLLPDQTVLIVNGASHGSANNHQNPVLVAEIFDPKDESFRFVSEVQLDAAHPRMYHSTALLLPDGRVIVAGTTAFYNKEGTVALPDDTTFQIYNPPYMFKGPRPVIAQAPAEVYYSTPFDIGVSVTAPANIANVVLMRPGAVTHSNDMDQRLVILAITARTEDLGSLTALGPQNSTVAPPGYYMLFIVDANDVPSRAQFVIVKQNPKGKESKESKEGKDKEHEKSPSKDHKELKDGGDGPNTADAPAAVLDRLSESSKDTAEFPPAGQAFIQPHERPPVGEQALQPPAQGER